jgi:hypothetical protein
MELKRQNELKAEAIRREQSERRAKEEAALRQRQNKEKREEEKEVSFPHNISVSDANQSSKISPDSCTQRLSNELQSKKMSEAKAKAEEQKLRMEQQKRKEAVDAKVRSKLEVTYIC